MGGSGAVRAIKIGIKKIRMRGSIADDVDRSSLPPVYTYVFSKAESPHRPPTRPAQNGTSTLLNNVYNGE